MENIPDLIQQKFQNISVKFYGQTDPPDIYCTLNLRELIISFQNLGKLPYQQFPLKNLFATSLVLALMVFLFNILFRQFENLHFPLPEDAALGVVGILYSYFTTLEKLLEALILRVTFPDPIYPDDKKQLKFELNFFHFCSNTKSCMCKFETIRVISVLLSLLKQWTADNICLSNEFIVAFVEFVNGLDINYEEQAKQLIQTLLEVKQYFSSVFH